jgi:hypothetical protein
MSKSELIAWCKNVVPNDIVMPVGDTAGSIDTLMESGLAFSEAHAASYLRRGRERRHSATRYVRRRYRLYGDRPRDELTVSGTIEDDVRVESKGRHYFFRSKLADEGGYYDGAGQRIQKVDFKTICSNGTGGFMS